jgi:SAM-dependent methyltransferase
LPEIDLRQLVSRLADRRPERTEANVQSDLHMLLTVAPLQLDDDQLKDIVLESPAGSRRRIDVEVGSTVFEVKRDLRVGRVLVDAEEQLSGYVTAQGARMQRRYVGVLTDGAEWRLYHLVDGRLAPVSELVINPGQPDVERLCVWLESVLATLERITPTPREIDRRLGALSPAHALDYAELLALFEKHRELPTVKVKRELWAKLLTTAFGTNFADEDALFVNHTLLVVTAEIIGHALLGFDLSASDLTPQALVTGALFDHAQIGGVVEPDFFDWVIEVEGGGRFVGALARRLSRFDWHRVEHDVMKVLYESVIEAPQRHSLGEYYTPDWLADEIVVAVFDDPLSQRLLDPGCGSGTFLFHAVRRYLDAAVVSGWSNEKALRGVTSAVSGVDVHPVAVTLARITYLLAIGSERLQAPDRPALAIPVYLGDSVQWGQARDLLSANTLSVPTTEGALLFGSELKFPERLLTDAGRFDQLVAELAAKATRREAGSAVPSLAATHRRFAIHPDDQPVLDTTFQIMCQLHDVGRDHIWGYYVRNLARPVWLSHTENRVDRLVGNPPWLAYRFMTESMQQDFRLMSTERGQWMGATVATHQDLSGLFVARCIELYLKDGGGFGFVMPLAALSRRQFSGFRSGEWPVPREPTKVLFSRPWDLHSVKPAFFPVPACAVFGTRSAARSGAIPAESEEWSGRLPTPNATRSETAQHLQRSVIAHPPRAAAGSPYSIRFACGATVFPRALFLVDSVDGSPLGTGAGRRHIRSLRRPGEKRPWRDVASLEGVVESMFVRPLHLGETILPYRPLEALEVVIPWDATRLLSGADEHLDLYPGLADWWRRAEQVWTTNRSSDRLELVERLDFRKGLSLQFPIAECRVVYSASGMYLAAATISDRRIVVEHKLYWAAVSGVSEACR